MAGLSRRVFVHDAVRTPRARARRNGGTLAQMPAWELLGQLYAAVAERGTDPTLVEDIVIGTSTVAGDHGADIARTAALWADWPDEVPGGVVSRLCCSGLDAIETVAAKVAAGIIDLGVAGGVESMSRVPMLSDQPPFLTDETLADRTGFVTIGVSADALAVAEGYTRAELDACALTSHHRAAAAPTPSGLVPLRSGGELVLAADEGADAGVDLERLGALPPLFGDDPTWARVRARLGIEPPPAGLHTVATAPQMVDGASLVVLGHHRTGETGREPVAEVIGVAQAAVRSPDLTGALVAARLALSRAGITPGDLDVVEANESFAASVLLMTRGLDVNPARVNPRGGAMAVGHPLGATGGILLADALDHLVRSDGEHALVTIPAALGLGAALVIRRLR